MTANELKSKKNKTVNEPKIEVLRGARKCAVNRSETKYEMLARLESEQAANPMRHMVHWVESGKAMSRLFSEGSTAQEFAMGLRSKGIGGIQIKTGDKVQAIIEAWADKIGVDVSVSLRYESGDPAPGKSEGWVGETERFRVWEGRNTLSEVLDELEKLEKGMPR